MPRLSNIQSLILILVCFSEPSFSLAEDNDPSPAEKRLKQITEKLPLDLKNAGLPYSPILGGDTKDRSRIRVSRMTSQTTAKITISFIGVVYSDETKAVDESYEYATLSLYLTWYKGEWTVEKYVSSSWFTNRSSAHDHLLSFIANVDESSTDKMHGEKSK